MPRLDCREKMRAALAAVQQWDQVDAFFCGRFYRISAAGLDQV